MKRHFPKSGGFWEEKIKQFHESGSCDDCKECAVLYMLKCDVWESITDGEIGMFLCLSCAEHRLGRPVEFEDLSEVPANNTYRYFHGLEPILRKKQ